MRTEADADGLRLTALGCISRHLSWHAVGSVSAGPRGGATDVGWKLMGGGRVGYLAGAENVIVRIRPEAVRQTRDAANSQREQPRLAELYYVSVPEPERTAAEWNRLLRAANR